jgi:tRNA nucleotidyltransferase (CCA-adding enzyme)
MVIILLSEMDLKQGKEILKDFHFSEKLIKHYTQSKMYGLRILNLFKKELTRARIYKSLHFLSEEVLLYLCAVTEEKEIRDKILLYLTELRDISTSVRGDTLKEMGYLPGPVYSKILFTLKLARLNNKVKDIEDEKERRKRCHMIHNKKVR